MTQSTTKLTRSATQSTNTSENAIQDIAQMKLEKKERNKYQEHPKDI